MLSEASEKSWTTGGGAEAPHNAEKTDAVLGEGVGRGRMLGRRKARRARGVGSRRDANTQRQTLPSRRVAMAMEGVIRGIEKEGGRPRGEGGGEAPRNG